MANITSQDWRQSAAIISVFELLIKRTIHKQQPELLFHNHSQRNKDLLQMPITYTLVVKCN